MRSRQATSRLTCPARMSFTVINRFAMAHLHSHLAVVYHHDSPTPGDVTPPAQPPNSTVRGGASLGPRPDRRTERISDGVSVKESQLSGTAQLLLPGGLIPQPLVPTHRPRWALPILRRTCRDHRPSGGRHRVTSTSRTQRKIGSSTTSLGSAGLDGQGGPRPWPSAPRG